MKLYYAMTQLDILHRLHDIVDNSNVDDALELLAYLDNRIETVEKSYQETAFKEQKRQEKIKTEKEYIYEIMRDLKEYTFLDTIIDKLRARYPHRTWSRKNVTPVLMAFFKENKIEKIYMHKEDPNTMKVKGGLGYRWIEGSRL